MPKTTIRLKTWRCTSCGYVQDFEPTAENQMIHFGMDDTFVARVQTTKRRKKREALMAGAAYNDIATTPGVNVCPACLLKGIEGATMAVVTDPKEKTLVTIMGEEEVDTYEISDGADENGKEKTRKLSAQEKQEMKAKIRADIAYWKQHEDQD